MYKRQVAISNRASNGVVQIRANDGTAGPSGEKTVAEFQDDRVVFNEANYLISGSATSTGSFGSLVSKGTTTLDGQVFVDTDSGNQPFYITRVGNATEALKIHVDDFNTIFESIQDETGDGYGGFDFKMDGDGSHPDFRILKGSSELLRVEGSGNVGIGTTSPDFKLQVDGTIAPESDDSSNLGSSSKRWADVFAVQTTTGGVFETGLRTEKIGDNPTGTIVSWRGDGLVPCDSNEDELVMGVIKEGKDEPIVMGAEPVLVTGKVNVGDYIVTSDKIGHGKSVKRGYLLKKDLFGKVIAQALESCDGDSNLIKCMIRKM